MNISIILIFLCGVANFAMHKATMESRHPMVEQMRHSMGKGFGGWAGYALEFAVLLAAMGFAGAGSTIALFVYGVYTLFNAAAAWMLLSGRM